MEGLWTRVATKGPLLPYVAGFAEDLARQGYADRTVDGTVRLISHLSHWLADRGRGAADLTPGLLEQFLQARREAGHHARSARAFAPLFAHLSGIGVVATLNPTTPTTPTEKLLDAYRRYLVWERGMAPTSVRAYTAMASTFLLNRSVDGAVSVDNLTPTEIIRELLAECRRRRPGSAMRWQSELRSLLRFLVVEGRISSRLAQAVPAVPRWRDASLPRALNPEDVARLLDACDRSTPAGSRDFAILTLLARLGLRRQEAVNLKLDDIDWRHGEITVQAKGRCEQLPLPSDVGEALSSYLRDRPRVAFRNLFLTVLAPVVGIGASGMGSVVRRACRRAGLPPFGAHRLRHTAATELLRAGASLSEVGQVLRHQDQQTTAIYAKVDRANLRGLAQLWPGGAR